MTKAQKQAILDIKEGRVPKARKATIEQLIAGGYVKRVGESLELTRKGDDVAIHLWLVGFARGLENKL